MMLQRKNGKKKTCLLKLTKQTVLIALCKKEAKAKTYSKKKECLISITSKKRRI
jgi:hypothetical protein